MMNHVLAEFTAAHRARQARFFPPPQIVKAAPAHRCLGKQHNAHVISWSVYLGKSKSPPITNIIKMVAKDFDVSPADIVSARRTAKVIRPRHVAIYLAKRMTPRSLPLIGRQFGGRDHTTVLNAIRRIENFMTQDEELAFRVARLSTALEASL